MLNPLFPNPIDNSYHGSKVALWMLGAVVGVKILQSLSVFIDGHGLAISADGIPLDTYPPAAAQTIVALFTMSALSRLILSALGVLALIRYRSAVPGMLLLLALEYIGRDLILRIFPIERAGTIPGPTVNLFIFVLTVVALALSLRRRKRS